MFDFIQSFDLTMLQWGLVVISGAFIGANKTGVVGISLISIPVLASVFGGRLSAGVILPMLIVADCFAVSAYWKNVRWKELLTLLPTTLVGIGIALYVGKTIPDAWFKKIIAVIIMAMLLIMIVQEIRGKQFSFEGNRFVNPIVGLLGGFSTMIGNAAGPIVSIYFLSLNMDKDNYIATRAWFFWIVNLLKVPLHVFSWHTITGETLAFDALLVPAISIGAIAGIFLVKKIPEHAYRIFVFAATFVSALFLVI